MCVGGVGGCRCVLELERQGKVCMYIENEVGLGGTSGLKSQLTLYFHWRKKTLKHSKSEQANFYRPVICTNIFPKYY